LTLKGSAFALSFFVFNAKKILTFVQNRDIIEMKRGIYAFFIFSKPILVDFDDNFCFSCLLCDFWSRNNNDRTTRHANLAFWAPKMKNKAPMGALTAQKLDIGDLVGWKEWDPDENLWILNIGLIIDIYVAKIGGREVKMLEIAESKTGKHKKDVMPVSVEVISKVSKKNYQ